MTQPLALVVYERLLPGSQIAGRLQDLNYRVQPVADARLLLETAEQTKPLLVVADLVSTGEDVCAAIGRLKKNPATAHLPVLVFGRGEPAPQEAAAAAAAGATLVVSEAAILGYLPQFLEQVLRVD